MWVWVWVSVCVWEGMAALQSDGSVGSVGSGWIGSLFLSPPTYLPIGMEVPDLSGTWALPLDWRYM